MKSLKKITTQKGNALIFFVLFILPILSFLLMLTFDVASIYTAKRKVQDVLDDASLQGVKFFPYKNYAISVSKNYLNAQGLSEDDFAILATTDGIEISYKKNYELVFSRLANTLFNASADLSWPVSAISFATPAIGDYLLLLDRGFYNSPNDEISLWGSEGEWPSALYFEMEKEKYTTPKYYTEQCFNEIFSPLKRILIDTYNFLEGFSLNSVGVGTYPGVAYKRDLDLIREIKKVNKNDRVSFLEYAGDDGTTTTGCFDASQKENQEEKYKAPIKNELYFQNNDEDTIANQENKFLFTNSLWALPVHKGYDVDFENTLDNAIRLILSSGTIKDRYTRSSEIEKIIFIFSTALPSINGIFFPDDNVKTILKEKLSKLDNIANTQDMKINIVYVLFENDKVDTLSSSNIESFENYFSNSNFELKSFNFFVLNEENFDDLQNKLMTFLQLHKKEGAIWR